MKIYFLNILVYVISVLLFLNSQKTVGANWENIHAIPINSNHSSGKQIRYFLPSDILSSDSILRIAKECKFLSPKNEVFTTLTTIEKPVWIYFKTPSYPTTFEQYVVIENVNFDLITLYKYDKNKLTPISKKGMRFPYSDDNLFPEQITFRVDSSAIYFIESYDFYNANFPIYIRTNNNNIQKAVIKNLFNAFYWGVISVVGLIMLFLFLQSKEIVFLYYALFLFGTLFLNLLLEGYAYTYLWPKHPIINSYKFGLYALSAAPMPLFIYHFLDIRNIYPKTHSLFLYITSFFMLSCVFNIFGYYAYSMYVLQINAFIQISIYIGIGFKLLLKGNKNALYFIVAWSIYLATILLAVLSASDIIPSTSYLNNYIQIGTLIQICIFSYILSGKYKEIKQRNIESQRKLIEVLKDRETALTNKKDELEKLVVLRTEELFNKNNELSTLNSQLNENVTQKTFELQKSLEEIIRTNDQLKQFNYITSHNLRGPVSSLKGLMNLYDIEKIDSDKKTYVEKMRGVINRMDDILIDLNKILSYKILTNLKETIHLHEIIQNNLKQLEISKNTIELNIDSSLIILGIKSYYESIFYNLLSNSIKYANPDRILKIIIDIRGTKENTVCITFSDNGIGMDQSKIADKLFGFYKRFHTHVAGKGLGLYITKTQIEQLGGTIRAETEINVGTTFIIELPL